MQPRYLYYSFRVCSQYQRLCTPHSVKTKRYTTSHILLNIAFDTLPNPIKTKKLERDIIYQQRSALLAGKGMHRWWKERQQYKKRYCDCVFLWNYTQFGSRNIVCCFQTTARGARGFLKHSRFMMFTNN